MPVDRRLHAGVRRVVPRRLEGDLHRHVDGGRVTARPRRCGRGRRGRGRRGCEHQIDERGHRRVAARLDDRRAALAAHLDRGAAMRWDQGQTSGQGRGQSQGQGRGQGRG